MTLFTWCVFLGKSVPHSPTPSEMRQVIFPTCHLHRASPAARRDGSCYVLDKSAVRLLAKGTTYYPEPPGAPATVLRPGSSLPEAFWPWVDCPDFPWSPPTHFSFHPYILLPDPTPVPYLNPSPPRQRQLATLARLGDG